MISVGQKAPDFSLPGVVGREPAVYDLHREIERGAVLLLFFPADFMPVCTDELRAVARAGWHGREGLSVWGLSGDSIFSHAAFAEEHGLSFPLLADFHGSVADAYGVRYDDWQVHGPAPMRAVVLVDPDWNVSYSWSVEDAFAIPDPSPYAEVTTVLEEVVGGTFEPIAVEYETEEF